MLEHINWLAVIVASVTAFIIGGIWYSPKVFLNQWLEDMNLSEDPPENPVKTFGLAYLFSFLGCAVLAFLIGPNATVESATTTGFLTGLAIVGGSFGINYQFAKRPMRALWIDGGYHTVQFTLFGLILGLWT